MAPEMFGGMGYSFECDIWSLGVMLYEFVCCRLPFGNSLDDPRDVCHAVRGDRLKFPASYKDQEGKGLIREMLRKSSSIRVTSAGCEELKNDKFFQVASRVAKSSPDVCVSGCQDAAGPPDLFQMIMERSLDAPYLPVSEEYSAVTCAPTESAEGI
mmetsp:Transcript_49752/g.131870  ORF Transcript_49752/g.131870 Transcript_49752/m.131870 type:complete len:156 (-) Transcript_49752:169-636(-)